MNIVFESASTDTHFEQILQLQKQNLFTEISEKQQADHGFVFVKHTVPLLKQMAIHLPQVVAIHQGKVIGYNLAMSASMKHHIPCLTPLFVEFERNHYQGTPLTEYDFMVGGQVCVDWNFRGQGLLQKLYHETRNRLPAAYQLCVTEIATRNSVSLKAHQKMGFETVSTYHDGKEEWHIVVWNLESESAALKI